MSAPSNPLHILLADDETSVTTSVSFVLKNAGHSVDIVHDGQEAFELLQKSPDEYQLLITDHLMQKVSGLELVQKLGKTKFHGRIFVLSAYLTGDLETSYRKMGVSHFMDKPFDVADLRNAVALDA